MRGARRRRHARPCLERLRCARNGRLQPARSRIRRRGQRLVARDPLVQCVQHVAARKIEAKRVQPVRVEPPRQRDALIGHIGVGKLRHRIGHQRGERHVGIGDLVHERRVRAVLQHAAHEVGQEISEAADRCIHAHGDLALGEQCFV